MKNQNVKKMKLPVLSFCLATAFSLPLSAASYTLSTGSGSNANGFADSFGNPFQASSDSAAGPGIVGFGVFSITDSDISSAINPSTLISAFQGFGASPTGAFTGPGFTGNAGTFSRNSTGIVGGSMFDGSSAYVFVGNGSDYASSTEFAVLKTSFTFDASDDSVPTPVEYTVTDEDSEILVGQLVSDVRTQENDSSETPGFQTVVVIPEPSVAVLGLLGFLGVMRRRR